MKKHIRIISGLATALSLTLSACGDDPLGVNSGDELSDAEIQALFNQLGEALGDVSPSASIVRAPDGLQLAEISVDQSVSVTAPCQSGTISLRVTCRWALQWTSPHAASPVTTSR
jgi:hypothetical protein